MATPFLKYPYRSGGGLFLGTALLRTWKDPDTLTTTDLPVTDEDLDGAIWAALCSVLVYRVNDLIKTVGFRRKHFLFGAIGEQADAAHQALERLFQKLKVGGYAVKAGQRCAFLSDLLHAYRALMQYVRTQANPEIPEKFRITEQIILSAYQNTPENN